MVKVAAIYLGTFTACMLLLFGCDRAFVREDKREPQVSAIAFNRVVAENQELRESWWKQRQESVKESKIAAEAIDLAGKQAARAIAAEQRVACLEKKLVTVEKELAAVRVMLDAARRDQTRIPLLGDDPQDRIPPQNVPLP